MRPHRRAYLEMLPALALTGLGALGAGALLGYMTPSLENVPGMLVMVPALMAMRGNISASMGSRLSSAVHLGLLDPEEPFGPVARSNLGASLVLSAGLGVIVGALGWAASLAMGLPAAGVLVFVTVAVATSLTAAFFLSLLTLFIVLGATHRGLDPDNVTGPLLTTVGDVITLTVWFVVLGVLV